MKVDQFFAKIQREYFKIEKELKEIVRRLELRWDNKILIVLQIINYN